MLALEIAAGVFLGLLAFAVFAIVSIWALSILTLPQWQRWTLPKPE